MNSIAFASPSVLRVGDKVGELRVARIDDQKLVLAAPQSKPIGLLIFALLLFTAWYRGSARTPTLLTETYFFSGLSTLAVSVSTLGYAVVIDARRQTAWKRRVVRLGRWKQADLSCVMLSLGHRGPREIIKLELVTSNAKHISVTVVPTAEGQGPVVHCGELISRMLGVPLRRDGVMDHDVAGRNQSEAANVNGASNGSLNRSPAAHPEQLTMGDRAPVLDRQMDPHTEV